MAHPLFIVDVFAEQKYAGNQLAVVLDAADLSEAEMQRIARETNFSETTFVTAREPRAGGFDVRIFTPAGEIPFAGHPTLGTAFVIREQLLGGRDRELTLNLGIGAVPVSFRAGADGVDLPWMSTSYPTFGKILDPAVLAGVAGLALEDIDASFPVQEVSLGVPFTFIPVRTLAAMKRARFRRDRYEASEHLGYHPCLYLFARETYAPENQLNARMFAEVFGIIEDPATGSASACLAAYALEHRYFGSDRVDVRIEQGYEIRRESLIHVRGERDNGRATIEVGGRVITSLRGELV